MILATILFVFFTGSAVLADDKCEQENTLTLFVPFSIVPSDFVYCATRVTGQNKQFCGLKLVSTDGLNAVLNESYYDETGTGFYKFNLEKESNGLLGTKYASTTVPSIEGQTITSYVTRIFGLCMTLVKCFQDGPWAGTENSGTYSAVVCPTKEDCKNGLYGGILVNLLNSTAGPKVMTPDWTKCPKY